MTSINITYGLTFLVVFLRIGSVLFLVFVASVFSVQALSIYSENFVLDFGSYAFPLTQDGFSKKLQDTANSFSGSRPLIYLYDDAQTGSRPILKPRGGKPLLVEVYKIDDSSPDAVEGVGSGVFGKDLYLAARLQNNVPYKVSKELTYYTAVPSKPHLFDYAGFGIDVASYDVSEATRSEHFPDEFFEMNITGKLLLPLPPLSKKEASQIRVLLANRKKELTKLLAKNKNLAKRASKLAMIRLESGLDWSDTKPALYVARIQTWSVVDSSNTEACYFVFSKQPNGVINFKLSDADSRDAKKLLDYHHGFFSEIYKIVNHAPCNYKGVLPENLKKSLQKLVQAKDGQIVFIPPRKCPDNAKAPCLADALIFESISQSTQVSYVDSNALGGPTFNDAVAFDTGSLLTWVGVKPA